MHDDRPSSRRMVAVAASAVIAIGGWALGQLGFKFPTWLVWPALALCGILGAYVIINYLKSLWNIARDKGINLWIIILIPAFMVSIAVSTLYYLYSSNIISLRDIEKETTELSGLTNSQIRARAAEVSRNLRRLDAEWDAIEDNSKLISMGVKPYSKESWSEALYISTVQRRHFTYEFFDKYFGDILILKQELKIRLRDTGKLYDEKDYLSGVDKKIGVSIIFEYKQISGVRPLTTLAEMIESMARALP